jgi:hypothetical protein
MHIPAEIGDTFRRQIIDCRQLGSPFTATVLEILLENIEAGGRLAAAVATWPGDPQADALPIRLAGAFHALVLSGSRPDLAQCYPSHAQATDTVALRVAIGKAIDEEQPHIARYLGHPPQTNETLRSAVLLGGFMTVTQEFGLPLRMLEIGASAGLNVIWDKYRYRLGASDIGPAASPVLLETKWHGPLPGLLMPQVLSRAACDQRPVELTDPAQQLRLRSYVWADQQARSARLEAAIALALAENVEVEKADAAEWLARQLAQPVEAAVTVIYHSVMWQYLLPATQQRLRELMALAGQAAPLAWLRFEPANGPGPFELRLTRWQAGIRDEQLLATAHPHGASVHWLAAPAS